MNAEKRMRAANQLMFDIWLFIHEHHDEPKESPYAELAAATRDMDEPALRIAHCLRDLAYGDESRGDDLVEMVQSDDPDYRALFVEALWVDG